MSLIPFKFNHRAFMNSMKIRYYSSNRSGSFGQMAKLAYTHFSRFKELYVFGFTGVGSILYVARLFFESEMKSYRAEKKMIKVEAECRKKLIEAENKIVEAENKIIEAKADSDRRVEALLRDLAYHGDYEEFRRWIEMGKPKHNNK